MVQLVAALMLLAAEPAPAVATSPEVKPAEAAPAVVPAPPAEPAATPAPVPTEPAAPAQPPAATAAPAPVAAPAPASAAAAAAPAAPEDPNAPRRFTASLGIGRTWPGGEVMKDAPMNDLTSPMGQLELTAHFRITPKWLVGITLDASSGGTPGALLRAACALNGEECETFTTQVALEGRYVFDPSAARTWWAGAGLGGETTGTKLKGSNADRPYLGKYTGGVLRLSGGWDRRMSRNWGWGFYGSLSSGSFDKVATGGGDPENLPADKAGHSWLGLGVRIILFP
jgi:hypothetical protein